MGEKPKKPAAGWQFQIRGAADAAEIEIVVYDVIGQDFLGEGVTAQRMLDQLAANPRAKKITLRINSIGGVMDDARAMVSLLRERAASGTLVEAKVDGLAASAAAYLTTAASRVVMPDNAMMMIHRARGGMRGTAADMEAAREALQQNDDILSEAFAAASTRRGKNKSAAEFLTAMTKADKYLRAQQAIDWGLADEKTTAIKVAACAVSLDDLDDDAPEDLRTAPFVRAQSESEPTPPAPPTEPIPAPAPPVAKTETNPEPPENKTMSENDPKTNPYAAIVASLGLIAGASETDILARLGRLRDLEVQASAILGVTDSAQLVGAIRGTKAKADTADASQTELAQVKAERDRQTFDSLIAKGQADRKLTPAEAKFEQEKFEAAVAEGRGSHAVAALQGYLNVAPRKFAEPKAQPAATGSSGAGALTWNGKAFAELAPMERHRLKADDPELYAQMRSEHQRQVA